MPLIRKIFTLFAALMMVVLLSGCATILIGTAVGAAGAYVWANGNLVLTVDYAAQELYDAARQALDDLDILVERDRHDRFGANISGRTRRGQKVLIKIAGQTEDSSWVRVRVGIWGDREQSQMVMNVILRNV